MFQVPYKLKDPEQDYDNYNQIPESPIGREEEPHLYMVTKKYRKVGIFLAFYFGFHRNEKKQNLGSLCQSGHN